MISYSVIIRTRGLGGDKYRSLLNSIDNLSLKPNEVIISLPEGAEPPSEKLGYEKFVFGKAGFISQRLQGFYASKNEYLLFLDDDVFLEENLAEKLSSPVIDKKSDISYPPLEEILPQGKSALNAVLALRATPMIFDKSHHLRLLPSCGYRYKKIKPDSPLYLYSNTAHGACFFTTRTAFKKIHFEDELWSDCFPYTGDDQIMFFKYYIYGLKSVCVTNAKIKHLDAGCAVPEKVLKEAHGSAFFRRVFFDRFMLPCSKGRFKGLVYRAMFYYSQFISLSFLAIKGFISPQKKATYKVSKEGIREAKSYIKSEQYKNLPKVDFSAERN